jgi:hypothetical protein
VRVFGTVAVGYSTRPVAMDAEGQTNQFYDLADVMGFDHFRWCIGGGVSVV